MYRILFIIKLTIHHFEILKPVLCIIAMSSSTPNNNVEATTSCNKNQLQHVTESFSDRMKSRELHQARQSGNAVPEMDVHTGSMINPHNPEFLTKRPWYLGGGESHGPSLSHQADQRADSEIVELGMRRADALIQNHRSVLKRAKRENRFSVGMWAEALRHNKKPYLICQIIKVSKNRTVFDLKYDDGIIEKNVLMKKEHRGTVHARIQLTGTGVRTVRIDPSVHGKESYDSKRDAYHGYDINMRKLEDKFSKREAMRRKIRNDQSQTNDTNMKQDEKEVEENKIKMNKTPNSDSDSDYDDSNDDSDDEFVQRDEDAKVHVSRTARQGGVGGQQMKITARNLRIREDTAKYLWNLDPHSAHYDPKSRSMRDNPHYDGNVHDKNNKDPSEVPFAGDNFSRISGEAVKLARTQVFAWDMINNSQLKVGEIGKVTTVKKEANDNTNNNDSIIGTEDHTQHHHRSAMLEVHPQANPSQAELLQHHFETQAAQIEDKKRKSVLDKYGGEEYLDGKEGLGGELINISNVTNENDWVKQRQQQDQEDERRTRFGTSLNEERYLQNGRVVRRVEGKAQFADLTSKYEEDVYRNGHVWVWGSFFHNGAFQWGYADDHSLMKHSYYVGMKGRIANDEANEKRYGPSSVVGTTM